MARLVFCFPYRGVGGVAVLFLRLAEQLGRCGVPTAIIDYADGYMARKHDAALTTLIPYGDAGDSRVPADAVLVLQAMTPWSIFPGLSVESRTRVWFWNCHPFNLVPTLPGLRGPSQANAVFGALVLATVLRGYRSTMRRFVTLLHGRAALAFMDRTNIGVTERYLGMRIQAPTMLAIPAPSAPARKFMALGQVLRVTWVGRLVDFKFHPLVHALRQLAAAGPAYGRRIRVDVVGGGDHEPELRTLAPSFAGLELRFIGELDQRELECQLRDGTDLLLAMGTSALEGARLGVPTLLLDLSYRPVPAGHRVGWLHEQDGYNLAGIASASPGVDAATEMLARLRELDDAPEELAQRARSYFERHHDLGRIAGQVVALATASRCTWGDLTTAGLLQRGLIYSMFTKLRTGVAMS